MIYFFYFLVFVILFFIIFLAVKSIRIGLHAKNKKNSDKQNFNDN